MKWRQIEDLEDIRQWTYRKFIRTEHYGVYTVSNLDLHLSPYGWGKDDNELFTRMLDSIAEYREKLDNVEAEIRQILKESAK